MILDCFKGHLFMYRTPGKSLILKKITIYLNKDKSIQKLPLQNIAQLKGDLGRI